LTKTKLRLLFGGLATVFILGMGDVMTDRLQNVNFSIFKISNFGSFKAKFYVSDEVFGAEKSSEKI
jgi:hypothetical protein